MERRPDEQRRSFDLFAVGVVRGVLVHVPPGAQGLFDVAAFLDVVRRRIPRPESDVSWRRVGEVEQSMSLEEAIRTHYLPKQAKQAQDKQITSSESWWVPKPGESDADYQTRFYAVVAQKQAELQASRFGSMSALIVGPEEPRPGQRKRQVEL
jgi:hypothetical protein